MKILFIFLNQALFICSFNGILYIFILDTLLLQHTLIIRGTAALDSEIIASTLIICAIKVIKRLTSSKCQDGANECNCNEDF